MIYSTICKHSNSSQIHKTSAQNTTNSSVTGAEKT